MRFAWIGWVIAGVVTGCASGDDTPHFAVDTLWTEPAGEDLHGYQTWTLYQERWERRHAERHHVCSVIVEFSGIPIATADCDDCTTGWATSTSLLDTDCDDATAADPHWLDLSRLAVGSVSASIPTELDPHPGISLGGYADYGDGTWATYGWAYPAALDADPSATAEADPALTDFAYRPAAYWDMTPAEPVPEETSS